MAFNLPTAKTASHLTALLFITLLLPTPGHALDLQFYGTLDGGFHSRSSKTQGHFTQSGSNQTIPFAMQSKNTGIGSGLKDQSKIGLRGSHDIGGGNQIFFQLEEDIDIATGHRSRDRGVRVIGIGG